MGQDYWGIQQPARNPNAPADCFLLILEISVEILFFGINWFVAFDKKSTLKTKTMVKFFLTDGDCNDSLRQYLLTIRYYLQIRGCFAAHCILVRSVHFDFHKWAGDSNGDGVVKNI